MDMLLEVEEEETSFEEEVCIRILTRRRRRSRFHVYICNVSSYCLFSKLRVTFRTIRRVARIKMIYLSKCSLIYL